MEVTDCVRIIVHSSDPSKDYWVSRAVAHELHGNGTLISIKAGQLHADRGISSQEQIYFEPTNSKSSGRQMEQQIVYLLIRHYSDEAVGTFDTTEAVFADETAAELRALEMNEAPDCHPSCQYGVQPMPVT